MIMQLFPKSNPDSRHRTDRHQASRRRSRLKVTLGESLQMLEARITPADISGATSISAIIADTVATLEAAEAAASTVVSSSTGSTGTTTGSSTSTSSTPPTTGDPNALSSTVTIVTVAAVDGRGIPAPVIQPPVVPPIPFDPPPSDLPLGPDGLPMQVTPPGETWGGTTVITTTPVSNGTIMSGSTPVLFTGSTTSTVSLSGTGAVTSINVVTTLTNSAGEPIASISITQGPSGILSSTIMTVTDPTDPTGGFTITTTVPSGGSVSLPGAPVGGYPSGSITTVSTSTPIGNWGPGGGIYETTVISTITDPDGNVIGTVDSTPVTLN